MKNDYYDFEIVIALAFPALPAPQVLPSRTPNTNNHNNNNTTTNNNNNDNNNNNNNNNKRGGRGKERRKYTPNSPNFNENETDLFGFCFPAIEP